MHDIQQIMTSTTTVQATATQISNTFCGTGSSKNIVLSDFNFSVKGGGGNKICITTITKIKLIVEYIFNNLLCCGRYNNVLN
jgi:hypothetical protein